MRSRPSPAQRAGFVPDRASDALTAGAQRARSPLQTAGNQQTLRALGIRAKLSVSQPSDPEEQEADRAADAFASGAPHAGHIARKCAGRSDDEGLVARQGTHQSSPRGFQAAAGALGKLARTGGATLPDSTRSAYERFLGADLSSVRLHSGQPSAQAAGALRAHAFTLGSDVHFAAGRLQPGTEEGQKLLVHELTHVAQQVPRASRADSDVVHRDAASGLSSLTAADFPMTSSDPRVSAPFGTLHGGFGGTTLGSRAGGRFGDLPTFEKPDPNELRFTERYFYPRIVRPEKIVPGCGSRCHQRDEPRRWTPPQDRRATPDRLMEWALEVGERDLLADANQLVLQLFPGEYAGMVESLHQSLRFSILGSHEFEGSETARQNGVDVLDWRWEEVRPQLEEKLETWFVGRFAAAIERAPGGAQVVSDPDELRRVLSAPIADATDTGRWGQLAKVGERWGAMVIEDIAQPAQTEGTVWFHLADNRWWIYEISTYDFRKWDPFVAEVARQVAENTRFAAELLPFLIKAFGFSLGLSARIGFVIAGIALEEFGEEYQREVRGQAHRSPLEILTSAGKSLLIDRLTNRLLGGGPKGLKTEVGKDVVREAVVTAEEKAIVDGLEEKAGDVIRREVVAAEGPEVARVARGGGARPVEDAALRREGYVVEVEVVIAGRKHIYRQLENGRWCRFSNGICELEMGDAVAEALKTPSERALEEVGGRMVAARKDQSLIVQAYEKVSQASTKKGGRIDADVLTAEQKAVLDELAPGEDAANMTLGQLKALAKRKVEGTAEWKALLKEEADLVARIASENRPMAEKLRALLKRSTKDQVKNESRGLDYISRGSVRPGDELSVEHIVPIREISEWPGLRELRDHDLIEFANLRRNLVPMSLAANVARRDRRYADIIAQDFAKYNYTAERIGFMRREEIDVRKYLLDWIAERTKRRPTR